MNSFNMHRRGVSLVELMVAVVIGMVLILAITQMMVRQDGIRRSVTGINDVAQSSAFATSTLDRDLRSAGSGLTQDWNGLFGCNLHVARDGKQVLPRNTAFPVPFDGLPLAISGATFLIHAGARPNGSDVLQVMSGMAGMAEVSFLARAKSAKSDSVAMPNTLGVLPGDLALITEQGRGCMVQQVAAGLPADGKSQVMPFGGTYAAASIDTLFLADFSTGNATNVAMIGNVTNNPPRLLLYGHDGNGVLRSLDLLRMDGKDETQVVGEGVLMLRALYGVDTNGDDRVDAWVDPSVAPFRAADLTANNLAARERLLTILAVRVGMLLRGDLLEREPVSPERLTLFSSLAGPLQVERTLTTEERRLRVRTYEITVPLRNSMLAARAPAP